jgi:ABC-2 type transport system permease protein
MFSQRVRRVMSALPVALVDEDQSEGSRALLKRLEQSGALALKLVRSDEALDGTRKGNYAAYVKMKKGFGATLGPLGQGTPELEAGLDPSRKAETGVLQGLLTEAVFKAFEAEESKPGAVPEKNNSGLPGLSDFSIAMPGVPKAPKIETRSIEPDATMPRSSFEVSFPLGVLWGLLGCVSAFSIALARERSAGTLERLLLAPISAVQILCGKGLACFCACLFEAVLLLLAGWLCFGVRIENPAGFALALASAALCFTGITLLLGLLGRSEQSVAGAGWAFLLVLAMFGGGMMPRNLMPEWMQILGAWSPFRWGIVAFEGALWRGFSLSELVGPCVALAALGIVLLGAASVLLKKLR